MAFAIATQILYMLFELLLAFLVTHYPERWLANCKLFITFVLHQFRELAQSFVCVLKGNTKYCSRWLYARSTTTIFAVIIVANILYNDYQSSGLDWALEVVNIYRVYEIVVINELRKELIATNSSKRIWVAGGRFFTCLETFRTHFIISIYFFSFLFGFIGNYLLISSW